MTLLTVAWRGVCAVVLVAVSALWVRTYYVSDSYAWTARVRLGPDSGNFSTMSVQEMVTTYPGQVVAHRQSPFG